MNRTLFASVLLVLLFTVNVCGANDRLVKIPYNPQTDLPKLASDLGVNPESITFHSHCAYISMHEWAPITSLESIGTCVVALTGDHLIVATWKADASTYVPVFKFGYGDITTAALFSDGVRYQVQLTTPQGFLAIQTSKYHMPPPGDASDAAEIFKRLTEKGVAITDSSGPVDLNTSTQFFRVPGRRH